MPRCVIPEDALGQHIAVLGKTGSGKTYAAKGIVERLLHERRQVCVLDPTGAWWGLRLDKDGKGKGYDIVLLGGAHADIPLAERSGAAVARLVTQQHANVVIDTSGFTVGEYTRWFIDFAGTLYTTIRDPLHLVVDEAHYFMPQGKSPDVDAGRMLHAGNRLMSGGRSKGIRGMLITQRPAKLHKDSLTCADTLIAMRVIAPQDRQAIKDWIDGAGDPVKGKGVLDSLAGLARGEGWVWYPEGGHLERVTFPKIETYDSSATPKHGAKAGPEPGAIKLDEVRTAMAEAVREAEANDPRLLRAEVAKLKAELAKKPDPVHVKLEKSVVEVPVLKDAQLKRAERLQERLEALGEQFLAGAVSIRGAIAAAVVRQRRDTPALPVARAALARPSNGSGAADPKVGRGGLRRILIALAQRPQGLTQRQIGLRAGLSSRSGTFATYLSQARAAGWIEGSGDLRITPGGIAALGTYDPLPEGRGLLNHWLTELGGSGASRILRVLAEAYPKAMTQEEVGAAAGLSEKSGSFATYLSKLRGLELVTGRGELRASDELF